MLFPWQRVDLWIETARFIFLKEKVFFFLKLHAIFIITIMLNKQLRILHCFYEYLNQSENWAFNLISHIPDTKIIIASKKFLRCNFYKKNFEYLEFPVNYIDNEGKLFFLRVINRMISVFLKLYPWYVRNQVGSCDLMHSHFAHVGWEYAKISRQMGIPHVISFYGFDYESLPFQEPVWRERYQQLFREADLFLCEGAHGAKILKDRGCPPEKIRVARLGVNIDNIPFWRRTKHAEQLNILQIARFTEKKGQRYTIDAFIHALDDCPNMRLTFVGGDSQGIKASLQDYVKQSGFSEKITFIDAIDLNQIYNFMKDYQVFIHPSCYTENMDCEGGAPIVLLDAQATGMPVIATNHCDIRSEVIHMSTGMLTMEKDTKALAQSIRSFYNMSQSDYDYFALNARKHVEDNYDVRKLEMHLYEIYRSIL